MGLPLCPLLCVCPAIPPNLRERPFLYTVRLAGVPLGALAAVYAAQGLKPTMHSCHIYKKAKAVQVPRLCCSTAMCWQQRARTCASSLQRQSSVIPVQLCSERPPTMACQLRPPASYLHLGFEIPCTEASYLQIGSAKPCTEETPVGTTVNPEERLTGMQQSWRATCGGS